MDCHQVALTVRRSVFNPMSNGDCVQVLTYEEHACHVNKFHGRLRPRHLFVFNIQYGVDLSELWKAHLEHFF